MHKITKTKIQVTEDRYYIFIMTVCEWDLLLGREHISFFRKVANL